MKFDIETRTIANRLDNFLTPISISDLSAEGRHLVYVNGAFSELTGFSRKECIGKNCRFLQGPETDPVAVSEITKFLDARECLDVCLTNYRADGSKFHNLLTLDYLDFGSPRSLAIGFQYELKPSAFQIEERLEAVNGMVELINTEMADGAKKHAWHTTRETLQIRETLELYLSSNLYRGNI